MLTHPTHDRLLALGLTGIAKVLEEQRRSTAFDDLSFEERLGLLIDREAAERDGKKLAARHGDALLMLMPRIPYSELSCHVLPYAVPSSSCACPSLVWDVRTPLGSPAPLSRRRAP